MNRNRTTHPAARIARALDEQRLDLELSRRQVAELAGVSRATVSRVEAGKPVQPALVVRIASALTIAELYLGKELADTLLEQTVAAWAERSAS